MLADENAAPSRLLPLSYPSQGELALRRRGYAIALPLIQGDDLKMVRRQWPLQFKRCSGISLEPRVPLRRVASQLFPRVPSKPCRPASCRLSGRPSLGEPRGFASVQQIVSPVDLTASFDEPQVKSAGRLIDPAPDLVEPFTVAVAVHGRTPLMPIGGSPDHSLPAGCL
jgi:hypothetical protein